MTLSPVLIQLRRKPVRRISSSLPLLSTARWGCGWGASWSSMVTDFPLKHRCYILLFIKEFYHLFVLCLHITDSDQTFMKQHWQAGSCNRNRAIQLDIVTATVLSGPHGDRTRSSLPVCNGWLYCSLHTNTVLSMPCIMFCFRRNEQASRTMWIHTYYSHSLMNESMWQAVM